MEKTLTRPHIINEPAKFVLLSLLGCSLITLCAFIKIPFYPVPFTLQTLAITFIALTQSPKQAFASVICYLLCGTLGLPVFTSGANCLWMIGKNGGYLLAFPLAAYLMSKLNQKGHPIPGLLCGQALIYLLGFLWLTPFLGATIAFTKGVAFFIPSDLLKNLAALGLATSLKKWSQR